SGKTFTSNLTPLGILASNPFSGPAVLCCISLRKLLKSLYWVYAIALSSFSKHRKGAIRRNLDCAVPVMVFQLILLLCLSEQCAQALLSHAFNNRVLSYSLLP